MLAEALLLSAQLDNSRVDTDLYTFRCMASDPLVVVISDLVETFPLVVNTKSFIMKKILENLHDRATILNDGLVGSAGNSVVVVEDVNPTLANGEGGVGVGTLVRSLTGKWNVLVSKSNTGVEKYSLDVKCFNPGGTYEPTR